MANAPLSGFVVAVTADRRAAEQIDLLARRGAQVLHRPTIATNTVDGDDGASHLRTATEAAIAARPRFVVFTTGMGARMWMAGAETMALDDQLRAMWRDAQVLARGPKAATALRDLGVEPWRTAEHEQAADLIDILASEVAEGDVVVVQAHGADDQRFASTLTPHGVTVIEVHVYRWSVPADTAAVVDLIDAIVGGRVHAVTFTAAPAIRNLLAVAEQHQRDDAVLAAFNDGRVLAACVGPVCAAAAHAAGIADPVAPEVGRLGLMIRTLTEALTSRSV